jgi:hypothetical protein
MFRKKVLRAGDLLADLPSDMDEKEAWEVVQDQAKNHGISRVDILNSQASRNGHRVRYR